jgi:hypothetical protein
MKVRDEINVDPAFVKSVLIVFRTSYTSHHYSDADDKYSFRQIPSTKTHGI